MDLPGSLAATIIWLAISTFIENVCQANSQEFVQSARNPSGFSLYQPENSKPAPNSPVSLRFLPNDSRRAYYPKSDQPVEYDSNTAPPDPNDYNEEPLYKGQDCQAMSGTPGECQPLNQCMMYEDVTKALLNNATPPYYFNYVHDKMACGFSNGPKTMICCETEPLEIPPSVNMPIPPYCGVQGVSTTRVVGGKPVTEPVDPTFSKESVIEDIEAFEIHVVMLQDGTYPWLSAIGYNDSAGKFTWQCGGSLITPLHVLTAAHCAHPRGLVIYKVRIGALTMDDEEHYWQERFVRTVREYKEYNATTKMGDIAIVVLAEKVVLTQYVHPICLPFQSELKEESFEKKRPFVAGWGRTTYDGSTSERLLQIQMTVRSNDECRVVFRPFNRHITPKHVCAGDADGIHDTCRGDSGAPLMQPIGNYHYVIGIVSYGFYCAIKGYPSVNVRVTEYIDWIARNIYDDI